MKLNQALSVFLLLMPAIASALPYPYIRPRTIPSEWARARAKAEDTEAHLFTLRASQAERERAERDELLHPH